MDVALIIMYVSTMHRSASFYREEHFRTPMPGEQRVGLWVDRIGRKTDAGKKPKLLRILGQYAVVAIERGAGWFESVGEKRRHVESGDVMILYPTIPTRYYPDPDTSWTTAWIVWNGSELETLERLGVWDGARTVAEQVQPRVTHAWAELSRILTDESGAAVLKRKILLLDLIYDLSTSQSRTTNPHPFLSRATALMQTPGMEGASVFTLAEHMGMSSTHFRRLFHALTGSGPKAFQTSVRITRAKELLADGQRIKEVAMRLEFGDEFHFMRTFKRVTGQTAAAFQRAATRQNE